MQEKGKDGFVKKGAVQERKRPHQRRSARPSTAPAPSPLAHLVHHLPPLRHHVEKALDQLELLQGQGLGLQGDSTDKEGVSSRGSTPKALYHCPLLTFPFSWPLRDTNYRLQVFLPIQVGGSKGYSRQWGNRGPERSSDFFHITQQVCGNPGNEPHMPHLQLWPWAPDASPAFWQPCPLLSSTLRRLGTLTLASRQPHSGETGRGYPGSFPGWSCPRLSGS